MMLFSPFLLLLLVLVCSSQDSIAASNATQHFYGTVMTYHPKAYSNGSVAVDLRYKLGFSSCSYFDTWTCFSGDCGTRTSSTLDFVDQEITNSSWCQTEGIMTRLLPTNAPFQLRFSGGNWISNKQGIILWSAVTLVELRNRSDTGKPNTSPQTTILPAVRVPTNCQRNFNLLAFDPDGDEVKCRYGVSSLSECSTCTTPSVLSLSTSCSLSFSSTNTSNEGAYVIQLVMEDFPRQTITLTQTNGTQTIITTTNAISKIPVQFAVQVDPVAPSCTEGLYLPKFLSPTPANGAQLYILVGQTLDISIVAQANISTISELLFSGPHNVNQTLSAAGQYTLRWTPSQSEVGESHPICFVVQAVYNSQKYQSELRCVIVTVGPEPTPTTTTTTPSTTNMTTPLAINMNMTIPSTINMTTIPNAPTTNATITVTQNATAVAVVALNVRISYSSVLTEDDRNTIIQQLKDELVKLGLPSSITLTLVGDV